MCVCLVGCEYGDKDQPFCDANARPSTCQRADVSGVCCLSCKTTPSQTTTPSTNTQQQLQFNPLTPTAAIWIVDTAIKYSVPDRVKPSFVTFDIRAL